jgi:hypothetical protein
MYCRLSGSSPTKVTPGTGSSSRYVSSTLFHRLGIDEAMQSKAQMVERIPVASEVAKGDVLQVIRQFADEGYAGHRQQFAHLLKTDRITSPPAGRKGAADLSGLTGGAGDHPRHRYAKRGRRCAAQPEVPLTDPVVTRTVGLIRLSGRIQSYVAAELEKLIMSAPTTRRKERRC